MSGEIWPGDEPKLSASATAADQPQPASGQRHDLDGPRFGPHRGLAAVAVLDPVEHRRLRVAPGERRLGVLLHHQRDPEDRGCTQQQADHDAGGGGCNKAIHSCKLAEDAEDEVVAGSRGRRSS